MTTSLTLPTIQFGKLVTDPAEREQVGQATEIIFATPLKDSDDVYESRSLCEFISDSDQFDAKALAHPEQTHQAYVYIKNIPNNPFLKSLPLDLSAENDGTGIQSITVRKITDSSALARVRVNKSSAAD